MELLVIIEYMECKEANEWTDGRLGCRHYRERAVGRNSADISVLHSALRRRELWSHIPVRQVRGIWHTRRASRYTQNTKYLPSPVQKHVCVYCTCAAKRKREEKKQRKGFCVSSSSVRFVFTVRMTCLMSHLQLQIL